MAHARTNQSPSGMTTGWWTWAGRAACASAVVAALGIVSLGLLYAGIIGDIDALLPFGPLNDLCVVLQYLLLLPLVVVWHRALVPHAPARVRLATLAAVIGIAGTTWFQYLLLSGRMPFEEQVPYVSAMVLLIGGWMVSTGGLARRRGALPFGMGLVWLAALYIGFPVWAWRLGRYLQGGLAQPSAHPNATSPPAA